MTVSSSAHPGSPIVDAEELTRLEILDSYRILDTPTEQGFEDVVVLASGICNTPVALVSLVAQDRQWFKARIGFDREQTPLSQSVCSLAIRQPGLFIVPDLAADPRTQNNTLVTAEPHIRFYAGARLETQSGAALGTLCVIDTVPRPEGLTESQKVSLEALARQVMTLIELRRAMAEQQKSARRQAFLLDLAEQLKMQGGPRGRMQAVVDALGRYLGVSRVGYGLVAEDGQTVTLDVEYLDGGQPLAGTYSLGAFGAGNIANLRAARTSVYENVEAHPDTAGYGLGQIGISAILAVPQVHEERLRSVLYVNHAETRAWLAEEVTLVERVATSIWDTVERLRAEHALQQALRNAQDFTQLALSAVHGVGVWMFDIVADRFTCDAAICALYGLDTAKCASGVKRTEFLANVHPDDMPALRATMHTGLVHDGDLELEYRLVHPDGSIRWVLSRGRTYFDEAGKPVRRTGVGIETTRQHLLEEQLRQAQKMEAIGQLTGGVAHDFNNLLTVILSSVELLRRPDLAEERRRRYIDAISDTAVRAAKLTGQLLAFARRQALKPEVFDAGKSIAAISDMLGTIAGARIRITTSIPAQPCFVEADMSQFDTALVNMAVNSRDAMDGEGMLAIAVLSVGLIPAVRNHPSKVGEFVAISIEDTGSGIAPADLDRIFEPFFTTKAVGQGTGLGLSQVFGFAKQSGGELRVQSILKKGTTFTLYLPRAKQIPLIIEPVTEIEALLDGHGSSVLVVEDNLEVGSFANETLTELGYVTIWASDAGEALEILAHDPNRFHVVFSDVVMPGMNGVELGREIRRLYGDLPVILTSGYSEVLAETGAEGFELLQKPYSIEQLSGILRKAAARRRG